MKGRDKQFCQILNLLSFNIRPQIYVFSWKTTYYNVPIEVCLPHTSSWALQDVVFLENASNSAVYLIDDHDMTS